jgi:hypothetical protein
VPTLKQPIFCSLLPHQENVLLIQPCHQVHHLMLLTVGILFLWVHLTHPVMIRER